MSSTFRACSHAQEIGKWAGACNTGRTNAEQIRSGESRVGQGQAGQGRAGGIAMQSTTEEGRLESRAAKGSFKWQTQRRASLRPGRAREG